MTDTIILYNVFCQNSYKILWKTAKHTLYGRAFGAALKISYNVLSKSYTNITTRQI
jgi:hypothetical protein